MIREIFLPKQIGKKRIIEQRILSISLQEDAVYATLVYAKQRSTIIEGYYTEKYEPNNQESLSIALSAITAQVKQYDEIMVALPASVVVIKELEIPFIDPEKIRMVLDYEIEAMLPFAVEDAVIDFIITETTPSLGTAQILAAAVRNQDLQQALDTYAKAGIDPASITVDLFSLYSLYQQITDYQSIKNATALVDLGLFTSRISFMQNGKLRMTRQIPRGLMTMAQTAAKESNSQVEDILEFICKNGIEFSHESNDYASVQKQIINFFNDIQFTLNSFSLKANFYEGITKIFFTGKAILINNFMTLSSNFLQIPCELFDASKIFAHKQIIKKTAQEPVSWVPYLASLGTGIPSDSLMLFTLRRKNFTPVNQGILFRQVIAAGILMVGVIGTVITMSIMQTKGLRKQVEYVEYQYKKKLQPILPEAERKKIKTFDALVKGAKKALADKEKVLRPVIQDYQPPLYLISEITELINRKKEHLIIDEITIKPSGGEQASYKNIAEVVGSFKTEQNQWGNWGEVKKHFKESLFLDLIEDPAESADQDKGIKFSAKFKLKDIVEKKA